MEKPSCSRLSWESNNLVKVICARGAVVHQGRSRLGELVKLRDIRKRLSSGEIPVGEALLAKRC